MELVVVILAWLLINTWTVLAILLYDGGYLQGWDELACIIVTAIISPWLFLAIKSICKFFKKRG